MTLGTLKKFSALLALPLLAVAASFAVGCDDDEDPTLGAFRPGTTPVTAAVNIPENAITAGTYAGTNLNLPVAVANALPSGSSVVVASSGANAATTSETTFDVSAGPTVEVTLLPAGTTLTAPGATLTVPYKPEALVEQGFAANTAALTQAIVEGAVFITKTSGIGAAATTEILTPVPGSATLAEPFTVQIAGLLSFSKFQGILDKGPKHTFDGNTATDTVFELPAGQFYAAYAGAQLTAEGGVGASRRAIVGAAAPLPTYTFTVKNGSTLPMGMTLSTTGALSGTPESATPLTAETKTFTIVVTDASGVRTDERTFSIDIAAATIGVVTTDTLPSGTVDAAYSQQLAVTGPGGTDVANYVWTIDTGLDNSGLSLGTTGLISGTPTAITGDSATYNFTVTATDTTTNVTGQPKPLTIVVYNPLVINTAALPGGLLGSAYNASIDASGGKAPLTFAVSQGVLPAGITMTAAGVFSGNPTVDDPQTFTVTVTDSDTPPRSVNQEFSIIYNAKPEVTALVIGTSGIVDLEFSFTDSDGSASTMGYTASFTYTMAGGTATAVKASAFNDNGVTLNNVMAGTTYTVKIDTSYSLAGLRFGADAAENVTFSVTITDNEFSNAGTGSDAEDINNAQELLADTSYIRCERFVSAAGTAVEIKLYLVVAPGKEVSALQYDFVYDTNVFDLVLPVSAPPGNPKAYDDGPILAAAAKSGTASNPTAGTIRVVVSALNTFAISAGHVGTIKLTVKTPLAAQDSVLTVTAVGMSTPQATQLTPRAGANGLIIIE